MNYEEQRISEQIDGGINEMENGHIFDSIEQAVKILGLSKRVKWKVFQGFLCRYTKKDWCPEFVIKNGIPVEIKPIEP